MTPRQYRLGRRAEAAAETRRRITEAVADLHAERGIARTSMKDIAERADVGIGTVYHHFPTYDDAIEACGRLTMRRCPPPSPAELDGHRGWDRVGAMVEQLMCHWARCPFIAEMRCEAAHYPPLAAANAAFDAWHADFVHQALAPLGVPAEQEPVVRALCDFGVWSRLEQAGFDPAAATAAVTDAVTAWLRSTEHTAETATTKER